MNHSAGATRSADAARLRSSQWWRLAVLSLRVAGVGVAIALIGLAIRLWSATAGLWFLGAGTVVYLSGVVAIFISYGLIQHGFKSPRPSFWHFRWTLLADAVRLSARWARSPEGRDS